jgi:hypothetical protein
VLKRTGGWVDFTRWDPREVAHEDLLEGTQNACRDECALVYGAERRTGVGRARLVG